MEIHGGVSVLCCLRLSLGRAVCRLVVIRVTALRRAGLQSWLVPSNKLHRVLPRFRLQYGDIFRAKKKGGEEGGERERVSLPVAHNLHH